LQSDGTQVITINYWPDATITLCTRADHKYQQQNAEHGATSGFQTANFAETSNPTVEERRKSLSSLQRMPSCILPYMAVHSFLIDPLKYLLKNKVIYARATEQ
jgi:hypothetical protein